MDVRSTAFRTDLRILELGGSTVEDRGTHLVVRSPHNPAYFWGNFILLRQLPAPGGEREVVGAFHTEFPEARHVAIGVDGTDVTAEEVAPFADLGLEVDSDAVLTASSLTAPRGDAEGVELRQLRTDDDWERRVELSAACLDGHSRPELLRFAMPKAASDRSLVEAGHAAYWGVFDGGRLLAGCGVVRTAPGEARFQSVETHPDARRRGLATAVVHRAGQHALDELGARTLVIVAEPGGTADRIYRSLGFTRTEQQLQLARTP